MRLRLRTPLGILCVFAALCALHYPLLHLPYFWDEAGYYIPAALDFYRYGLLIPQSTLPTGHPPLVTVYLGIVWRLWGFSPMATRTAMIMVAAASVVSLYALARRVGNASPNREFATWSALLLALSPLFFAQSSMVHLDLTVGLFTTLAVYALLGRHVAGFAVAASLAVLSKETAAVLLPVAWAFAWRIRKELPARAWMGLAAPLFPLLTWTAYYHHSTGHWTGNSEYLQYNLFSTLYPGRVAWSLLRRLYEIFIGGFNWPLVAGAALGFARSRMRRPYATIEPPEGNRRALQEFRLLAGELCAVYVLMLSLVGGAILPRYLLPIFPVFFLLVLGFIWPMSKALARGFCLITAVCFVGASFINPPYPFPFEDNLAYADFVRLHQQAAQFLEERAGEARILTAWPASDELARPFLGYVRRPLRTVPIPGFSAEDFVGVSTESFDLLYFYSRKWQPRNNWLTRFPQFLSVQRRYFDYAPQIREELLVARYHLRLLRSFERRDQWVRLYSKQSAGSN